MTYVLNRLWDLDQPGARCTVDDLERGVAEAGLARFTGLDGLHVKVWYRDGARYGSTMVFADAASREATAAWVTDRVSAVCGLSLIHISEPTRLLSISYAVFCLKKKTSTKYTANSADTNK